MAKTWTATDVTKNRPIKISQIGANIEFLQTYQFKDANGAVMEMLGDREVRVTTPFASLPSNIQNALTAIQNYLYNQAITNEGI